MSIIAAVTLAACQTNQQTGAIVGGVAGAAVGSLFGQGTGKAVAVALGAAAGAYLGSEIGKQLDEAERERAAVASRRALEEPRKAPGTQEEAPVRWTSPDRPNTYGETKVLEREQVAGRQCVLKRDTAYIEGKEVVDQSRVCRTASGGWEKVA